MRLLFLPGYACTSAIWLPLRAELASRHAITLLDWPHAVTPGFETLQDFADWLSGSMGSEAFDWVVGHSMGGLVALDWLASADTSVRGLVLVETFLLPPPAFFRNVLLSTGSLQATAVHAMLADEKRHYSPRLPEALRVVDLTGSLPRTSLRVNALYGDRGCGCPERVAAELGWPPPLSSRIEVSVIPNACHFPMLENPGATARAVCHIIDQADDART